MRYWIKKIKSRWKLQERVVVLVLVMIYFLCFSIGTYYREIKKLPIISEAFILVLCYMF